MSDETSVPAESVGEVPPMESGAVLKGTTASGGLAVGRVRRRAHEALAGVPSRVPLDGVEHELNRFHQALVRSRTELQALKERIRGEVPAQTARVLDVHMALLKDSAFLADVENLVMNEQLALEGAIAKVVADFDRIFKLVSNESLRERAVDLRDAGLRVLRCLEGAGPVDDSALAEGDGTRAPVVLAARELSIVDMFNAQHEHVAGIVVEHGGLDGHAAQMARSLRIPTLVGVEGLLAAVQEGDLVVLDASEGVLRVRPDPKLVEQYGGAARADVPRTRRSRRAPVTRDGVALEWSAQCGSLPELEDAVESGFDKVGLYRTELLHFVDRDPPGADALAAHYSAVLDACGSTVFRLLDADSTMGAPWLHDGREPNPALGLAGVRLLLAREPVLRRQLSALLRACEEPVRRLSLATPFVVDCGELRRVKEALYDERRELRRAGLRCEGQVEVGAVVETPAAVFGAADIVRECDHVVVALDSLQEHVLAADRANPALAPMHETLHPFVLRALDAVVRACEGAGRPLAVSGRLAVARENLAFVLGVGVRRFVLEAQDMDALVEAARAIDLREARRAAQSALRASSAGETRTIVDALRHGMGAG